MRIFRRPSAGFTTIGLLLLAAVGLWLWRNSPPPPAAGPPSALSALAEPPDWSRLDAYQHTISRSDFEHLLTSLYTTGEAWRECIQVDDTAARIQTGQPPPADSYRLVFSSTTLAKPPPRQWRTAAELPPAVPGKPLSGLRLAIDPGHIGGKWAMIEERRFQVGTQPAVCEGDLTLDIAKRLKPRLEALGATVFLVRETTEPLTPLRPEALLEIATQQRVPGSTETPQKLADRLFYRTAEIRARAKRVNETLRPDLVLCLHFNAEAWGSAGNPLLTDRSHLHLLINGAYSDAEVRLADQRFALLHKLLQRSQTTEIELAADIAHAMAAATGLPPFNYPSGADTVRAIPGQPYLWARNLLANRLYQCPVVFLEPYVMNSRSDYARLIAGDYDGLREIAGQPRRSIFREYTDALVAGLTQHFARLRTSSPPPP